MQLELSLSALVAGLFWCTRFAQATEPVRLVYSLTESAQSCATENDVRRLVAERLGYDPFRDDAKLRIGVVIDKQNEGFAARIELSTKQETQGIRELDPASDCAELIARVVLSLSVAIDPEREVSPVETKATTTSDPVESAPPRPAPPPQLPRSRADYFTEQDPPSEKLVAPTRGRKRLQLDLALGIAPEISLGMVPTAALGASLFFRLRRADFAFTAAARWTHSVSMAMNTGGYVRVGSAGGMLIPCWYHAPWLACGVLYIARLDAHSRDVTEPAGDSAYYLSPGLRLGFEWPKRGPWALLLQAESLANVTPVKIELDRKTVWSAPPITGSLAAGGVARF